MDITLTHIPREEVLRYLGCPGTEDPATLALVEGCSARLLAAARPKWTYRVFDLAVQTDGVRLDCGLLLPGRDLAAHLRGCSRAALLAATLSAPVDALLRRAQAEDLAAAQLATVGVDLDTMKREGVVELPDPNFQYGTPKFKTPSGKFEFSSEAVGAAGLNPVIGWIPRKVTPKDGEFAIVGGKQGIHSHTMTQNIACLNAISREYHMERLWISAQDAEDLGVQTGDTVEVASSEHVGQVEARVTQRLKPGVVFLPTHYGGDSPAQTRAYRYGIALTDFIPFDMEPGVGSMMSQEVAVTVKKVEA